MAKQEADYDAPTYRYLLRVMRLAGAVIPGKVVIYSANPRKWAVDGLDCSRHGGTGMAEVSGRALPNETNTWGKPDLFFCSQFK